MAQLDRLKSNLQAEEASTADPKGQKSTGNRKSFQKKTQGKTSMEQADRADENKSFAELFAPQDEDDASFEEMLKDSKMDWRKFK